MCIYICLYYAIISKCFYSFKRRIKQMYGFIFLNYNPHPSNATWHIIWGYYRLNCATMLENAC